MIYHILACMKCDAKTFFSALANHIRLRCLMLLQLEGELCVCELIHALNLSQPMISRHLALLRETGLVNDRRVGQWIYYSLHPDLDVWAKEVLAVTAKANQKQSPYVEDLTALRAMANRPGSACCA
jgi:ArsR family transcriptional regulator